MQKSFFKLVIVTIAGLMSSHLMHNVRTEKLDRHVHVVVSHCDSLLLWLFTFFLFLLFILFKNFCKNDLTL